MTDLRPSRPSTLDAQRVPTAPPDTPTTFAGTPTSAAALSAAFALLFAAWALIHRGSSHQDAANHFGYAADGARSLSLLLDPWGRPLWSLLVMPAAQLGIGAARVFCAALAGVTLYQTWKLARLVVPHSALLAIPALGLQFHFFALAGDNMTEPVFALFFALAYRLWLEKKTTASLLVASLLPLARPEGFFLGILWGFFVLASDLPLKKRLTYPLLLLGGTFLWFLGGLVADGDPLFIVHHWPPNWTPFEIYGFGRSFHYVENWPEYTGAAMLLPFLLGFGAFAVGRPAIHVVTFLFFFLLHTILWWKGLFGSIGYLRYFVCISPLIALFCAEGLRFFASFAAILRIPAAAAVGVVLAGAAFQTAWMYEAQGLLYVFAAYEDAADAWRADGTLEPLPEIVADAHARHVLHRGEYWRHGPPAVEAAGQLAAYAKMPVGTRILWDDRMGGGYYALGPAQFAGIGYRVKATRAYDLDAFRAGWYRAMRGPRPEPIAITVYEKAR
ncbi:MAG: hypothetical protein HYY18_13995 [Planctomycetes bacterium]|nr:hypothetical protein [Planctomycetota bacterium]